MELFNKIQAVCRVLVVFVFVCLYVVDISSAAVSDTSCTSGGTECDSIPNAECDTSACQCEQGYTDNLGTCEEIAVSDTSCTSGGTECDSIPNAECDTSACQCEQGYTDNLGTCEEIAVSDTTCTADGTECDSIANSECDTSVCQCEQGYTDNSGTCEAKENGARGMTANIELLCAILMMLSYMKTL